MKKTVKWVAWRVYKLLPKFKIAVLSGFVLNDDTVLALERSLRDTDLRRIVILVSPWVHGRLAGMGTRTVFAVRGSLRSFAFLAVAKYVFFTHASLVHRFPPSVTSVNVWHGMPVKRVGWTNNEGSQVPVTSYSVATSPFWAEIVQESLRPRLGTLVTGLPRNDHLRIGGKALSNLLGHRPESSGRFIVWLPTFRGAWGRSTHSLQVPEEALKRLDALLEEHDSQMIVKPHPMALPDKPPKLGRFHFVTDDWLLGHGATLYELLGESDALVTDVSSVYVDYLILDRPVVHYFPDIRKYEAARGFSVTPIDDYLAGPLALDPEELIAALREILLGNDPAAATRRRLTSLFHTDVEASAASRLVREVGL